MEISVVIPTKDRVALLTATLERLFSVCWELTRAIEVIVVDDGKQDLSGLKGRFSDQPLRIIPNKGSGAASARNTGARLGRHPLLLFLDDDILVGERNLEHHLDAHRLFANSLVSGVARLAPELVHRAQETAFGRYKLAHDYALDSAQRLADLGRGVHRVAGIASFNLSLSRDSFEKIGGFNPRLPYAGCEDQEFSIRARDKGLDMLVDEAIECHHNELDRLSPERWFLRQFTGIQGTVLLAHQYPDRRSQTVYRALSPISRQDSFRMVCRKLVTRGLALGPIPRLLLSVLRALEGLGVPDAVLFQGYRMLWVTHAHLGFREGLRRLESAASPIGMGEAGGG